MIMEHIIKIRGNTVDLEELSNSWPSTLVARNEMEEFTRGLYKGRSFNTYDGAKIGIKRRIRLNTKIAYLKSDVIDWLKNKTRVKK